ncbi:MAG: hypothetical protein V4591_03320 [Bdellovibrionota bacterium]
MKIEHLILANNSSVDMETNLLSVFGFMEDFSIMTPKLPLLLPVQIIATLKRMDELEKINSIFQIKITNPVEQEIFTQEIKVVMEAQHVRQRLRVNTHLPISASGNYCVFLIEKNNPSLERIIEVKISVIINPNVDLSKS